jgi:RNA 2',3'-cyclic 3'-phosphodiesterase
MENNNIRSFVAISLSDHCRKNLAEIILHLKKEMPPVIKWTDLKNIHLTLKFLGTFNSRDIGSFRRKLENAFSGFGQFNLNISTLGVFPNERKPKIIWVGASSSDSLKQLFSIIEEAAFSLGYSKEERNFNPHITIARVKDYANSDHLLEIGRKIQANKDSEICISEVNSFSFFQSELTSSGPVYSELFTVELR